MASVLKLKTDIKKLKAAIASKATSGAIKTKLRGKLSSLENELDKLQPNKRKPKTTGPKSESALVKLAKKRRTNQGLSTSKSDIDRDAVRPAKKAGKRISASGNTYYEYRDNRIDNRQPPKKYRKLADGGMVNDDYRKKLENHIYKTSLSKEVNGFELVKLSWDNEGVLLWTNKQRPELEIYATPFYTPDHDINFEVFVDGRGKVRKDQEYKLTGDLDKDTETYFNYLEAFTKKYRTASGSGGDVKSLQRSLMDKVKECEDIIDKLAILYKEDSKSKEALTDALQMLSRSGRKVIIYTNNEDLKKMADGGYMADGGSVAKGNYEMLMSQAKEVMHHAEELMQVVKPNMDIEAWVVSKAERATTDLSDITHYLDGLKMAMGGMVKHNAHKVNG